MMTLTDAVVVVGRIDRFEFVRWKNRDGIMASRSIVQSAWTLPMTTVTYRCPSYDGLFVIDLLCRFQRLLPRQGRFIRFFTRSSTTAGSARVEVSPSW